MVVYNSIRTYQQQHCLYTKTHDHAGSLCTWLIALFQVEMVQWIPLGHVTTECWALCPECPECPKCVRDVRFQTGHFGHARCDDTVRSCPVMSRNMSGHVQLMSGSMSGNMSGKCPECPVLSGKVSGVSDHEAQWRAPAGAAWSALPLAAEGRRSEFFPANLI